MEKKSKKISLRTILIAIAIGVWVIVLQNAGVIPTDQRVKVVNTVDADAHVSGRVSVDNTVDVNIHEINGYNMVTTKSGTHSVFPYGYTLPVENW
jgi:hypothetical protein